MNGMRVIELLGMFLLVVSNVGFAFYNSHLLKKNKALVSTEKALRDDVADLLDYNTYLKSYMIRLLMSKKKESL